MKKTLVLLADINAITGYGKHAIQVARDFTNFGYSVKIRPAATWEPEWGEKIPDDIRKMFVSGVQPEPVELLLHPPNFVPTPGKRTVYFTMHESTRLPKIAVNMLNKADVVVVPCKQNASDFRECGVFKPINVVPLGIDTSIFNYKTPPKDLKHLTRFGCAGRMAHGGVRKGINEVIDIFREAFPADVENVRLDVKGFPDCPIQSVSDPRICIHQAHWTDQQLAYWFSTLTCFVSAAKGEGWGLMQHQALAVGRTLMSVRWCGVEEFFEPWMGHVTDHELKPAQHAYEGQGLWAVPDKHHMIQQMRLLHGVGMGDETSRIDASAIVSRFSWQESNQKLKDVIESL